MFTVLGSLFGTMFKVVSTDNFDVAKEELLKCLPAQAWIVDSETAMCVEGMAVEDCYGGNGVEAFRYYDCNGKLI